MGVCENWHEYKDFGLIACQLNREVLQPHSLTKYTKELKPSSGGTFDASLIHGKDEQSSDWNEKLFVTVTLG